MPRGVVGREEYLSMSSTWFKKPLEIVDNQSELRHTSIFYRILSPDSDRICDCLNCTNPATFLHHDVDHNGQIFINFMCDDDAPPYLIRKMNMRD